MHVYRVSSCLSLTTMFLLLNITASAQVFNRVGVITGENSAPPFSATRIIGERVFFVRRDGVLQVSDGRATGTLELADRVVPGNSSRDLMMAFNDELYFFRRIGGPEQAEIVELWRSDGTAANTRKALQLDLPPSSLDLGLQVTPGRLLIKVRASAQSDDFSEHLAVSDGTQAGTAVIPIINPDLRTLCAIDDDNFYVFASNDEGLSNRRSIVHFRAGQVQTVHLEAPLFEFIRGHGDNVGSKCLYEAIDLVADISQAISLDASGNQQLLTLPTLLHDASDRLLSRLRFQDRLLLFRSVSINDQATEDTQIFEFDPATTALIPTALTLQGTELSVFILTNLRSSIDQIYATAVLGPSAILPPISPPPPPLLLRFDSDFNLVGEPLAMLIDGTIQDPGDIVNLDGVDYFMANSDGRVSKIIDNVLVTAIRPYDMDLLRVVSQRGVANQSVFAFAKDRQTNLTALYHFTDQPTVSERLAGIWNNDAFNRTGVQINTAVVPDGRRFLFLALLAHADGEPVWMAGAIPIVDGNVSATIDLNLSSGLPFLVPDPGLDAERTAVGQATINVVGCDELNISFDLIAPFGFHQHDFKRLLDTTTAPLCSDVDASL